MDADVFGMLLEQSELEERLQAPQSHGPQAEPSDQCLFLPGLAVYFQEGINVYFDMLLACCFR